MPELMTKTQIMALVAADKCHECFTYYPEDGPSVVYDITAMRAWALVNSHRAPIFTINISDVLDRLLADRVHDEQRIAALPDLSWQNDPAMVLAFHEAGGLHHLLIDGTHRIIRRHREGLTTFQCFMIDSIYAIKPDYSEWVDGEKRGLDWGDKIVDGKIVKRDKG